MRVPWNHGCDMRTKFRSMGWKKLPDTRERILFIFFSISDYVFEEGLCLDYLKDIGERGKQV